MKRHSESLYDPNISEHDVTARIQGEGRLEEVDGLLYVMKEVYIGNSSMGLVIFVSRAPIMKGGLVARRYDETLMHVTDVI